MGSNSVRFLARNELVESVNELQLDDQTRDLLALLSLQKENPYSNCDLGKRGKGAPYHEPNSYSLSHPSVILLLRK